jgi:hypothetical protein
MEHVLFGVRHPYGSAISYGNDNALDENSITSKSPSNAKQNPRVSFGL